MAARGDEVLHEIGGAVGRYLSELYHRVEDLEAKLSEKAEAPRDTFREEAERDFRGQE
ncbi:MAG: hypothetical protein M0027_19305 [Candidatus Dormibacteraeota bacterium]|jgi:hypothetical protein|nr:hypothetical protein [Candidatus Dormibacteraeota bacterium]